MDNDYPPSVIPQESVGPSSDTKTVTIPNKIGTFVWDIVETVVFALAIFVIVYLFIAQPHQVSGNSMHPNFTNGEYILTDKIFYKFSDPQRGEVIIFRAPTQKDYIKRIIGLPGEQIKVENGKVYINGQVLPETYLPETLFTTDGAYIKNGETLTIPEGNYVVMGDNRSASSDSRDWGFRTKKDIVGKAWLIYWPFNKFGLVPHANY